MSFYGKIYQEVGNAFRNFLFGNKDKTSTSFPKDDNVTENIMFEAGTSFDQGIVQSGNRWIKMAKPENGRANEVEIYHGEAGGETDSFTTIAEIKSFTTEEELAEKQDLIDDGKYMGFGKGIVFSTFTYDKAGHVVETDSQTYVLPESPNLNLGQELSDSIDLINTAIGLPLSELPEKNIYTRLDELGEIAETVEQLDFDVYGGTIPSEEEGVEPTIVPGLKADVERIDIDVSRHSAEIGDVTQMGLYAVHDEQNPRGISETFGNVYDLSPSAKWNVDATVVGLIGDVEKIFEYSADSPDTYDPSSIIGAINQVHLFAVTAISRAEDLSKKIEQLTKRLEELHPETE